MSPIKEDVFALTTKLLKKALIMAKYGDFVKDEPLNFRREGKGDALHYSIEQFPDGKDYLVLNYNGERQSVLLSYRDLKYGRMAYLTCPCGVITRALYLKGSYFACRRCQKLHYRTTTINTTSDFGYLASQNEKRLRLMDLRESINRIFYRGDYTKKFKRYLELCRRLGLNKEVVSAQKLIDDIRKEKSKKN